MVIFRFSMDAMKKYLPAILILVGAVAGLALTAFLWRATDRCEWVQTSAVVISIEGRFPTGRKAAGSERKVTYRYWVDGKEYYGIRYSPGSEMTRIDFKPGETVGCFYNAANPAAAVLSTGGPDRGLLLFGGICLTFLAAGVLLLLDEADLLNLE